MKSLRRSLQAFTLIELLVVISIIAILASLALPAITGALARGQVSQAMSNARNIYAAQFRMFTDGVPSGDTNLAWPADMGGGWAKWSQALVDGKYLSTNDFNRMLSAPGLQRPLDTPITQPSPSALKVFNVAESNNMNTVFMTTVNYVNGQPLDPNAKPFGDNGFVAVRKDGAAQMYTRAQATNTNLISPADFVPQLQ